MRFWMVIDPRLRGCAFCAGHGYSRADAQYHAMAWHGPEFDRGHGGPSRVPVIGRKRPRVVRTYGRTWEYLPEFRK